MTSEYQYLLFSNPAYFPVSSTNPDKSFGLALFQTTNPIANPPLEVSIKNERIILGEDM